MTPNLSTKYSMNATPDFLKQTNSTDVNTHICTVADEENLRDVNTEEAKL